MFEISHSYMNKKGILINDEGIEARYIKELILLAALKYFDSKEDNYISVSYIAHFFGYSKAFASKKLKEIEKEGFIKIVPNTIAVNTKSKLLCNQCMDSQGILEIHHIVHKSIGGLDDKSNLVLLCPNCHTKAHSIKFQFTRKFNDHFRAM